MSKGGGGGGGQQPAPQSSTVRQITELPEYYKPYAKEMLETASDVYDAPYEAYGEERLAEVTPSQRAAFTGLESMYAQVDPTTGQNVYFDPSEAGMTRAGELAERSAALAETGGAQ